MQRPLVIGILFCVAAGLATFLGACSPQGPRRNLIVITLDTVRADALSCYGGPPGATPALDALAARGLSFARAYAPMPQTLPSHATLFTGLQPREHEALENFHMLPERIETLAERLSAEGYFTAAFIGARVLDDESGIQQGFRHFDLPRGKARDAAHPVERRAAAVTDSALAWSLTAFTKGEPVFLWAHYYDAHGPYEPPTVRVSREAAERQMLARPELAALPAADRKELITLWHGYLNEVAEVDAQIDRLLRGLEQRGLLKDAVIVVVGDHGEGLMEHGERSHGVSVFEELMLVPLIVVAPSEAWPAAQPGSRVQEPIRLEDLLPLMQHLVGQPVPAKEGPGAAIVSPLLAGQPLPPVPVLLERPHYAPGRIRADRAQAHGWGFGELVALIEGREKLVLYPDGSQQLFDLDADPDELRDLVAERPESVERLRRSLEAWRARHPVAIGEGPDISPERAEALNALGYAEGPVR
ncbi:MAG: sulfatase family protein [Planctomycetota bacterium]